MGNITIPGENIRMKNGINTHLSTCSQISQFLDSNSQFLDSNLCTEPVTAGCGENIDLTHTKSSETPISYNPMSKCVMNHKLGILEKCKPALSAKSYNIGKAILNPSASVFVPKQTFFTCLSDQIAQYRNLRSTFDSNLNSLASPSNSNELELSEVSSDYDGISISNSSPKVLNFSTPNLSHTTDGNSTNVAEISVLSTLPALQDVKTPEMVKSEWEKSTINRSSCTNNFDESHFNQNEGLNSKLLFQKYVCKEFCHKEYINHQEVSLILKKIRIENINRVIISHLNVNFFAVKIDSIRTIVSGNIDIMVFSETKIDASYPTTQLKIDGFKKPYRLDRNAFGGGILIYVRQDIPSNQLKNHNFADNIEGIFIEINLRKSKWLIFGTYHPPTQNNKFYFDNIGRALDFYTQKYDKILLAGDFNAEENEVILSNFMQLYDLRNLVKENTCFKSVDNPSCVDLFLTNCSRAFQNTIAISTGISDVHKMIITVLKTTFKKAKPKEIIYRTFRNFDEHIFSNDLKNCLVNCKSITEFESKFLGVIDKHAPQKKKVVRATEVPYMTKALRKAIADRSRLENRYYKSKTEESLRAYKKQKNFCSRLYKKERKKYYTNLDLRKITDSKKFWKTAKPFFSDKGVDGNNIALIEGEEIYQEDHEVAKILGEFFNNAVKSLNVCIPSEYISEKSAVSNDPIDNIISKYSNHPSIKLINDNVIKGNFSFNQVSLEDVNHVIAKLDVKKASLSSSIPSKFIKDYSDICSKPLTDILNDGILNSYFDIGLKYADLTPVHKAEEATNKKNYRNISLLPAVSKIFEKLLHTQIASYMEEFLSPYLCGYRKGYSAQYALLAMLEKWRISLDNGGYGGGVLMDLSKAFDTLDHGLLIAKLFAYGFNKNALSLIKSYLTDRWQRVKINTSYSSWFALLVGMPQGSILGPLIFNLYINDLFFTISTDICNFADDTTPYTIDMNLESLMARLECATKSALQWFYFNGMKLNSSKCHLLVCGHKFECMLCEIDNTQIIETHLVKLLGVTIESELTFKNYMETVCKKASQKLNALSRLCAIIPFQKRRMLMQAFFISQFSYCPLVWMFHSRNINTRINNLHFRALRMVYRDETSTYEELLKKDGTVTIHHRNLQCLAIEMFKVDKGLAPVFMNDIFPKHKNTGTDNISSNTRSNASFYNPSNPKTVNYGLETLRCLGPKLWQLVPRELREIQSLNLFTNKIKTWNPQNCPCRLCKSFVPQLGFV